MYGTIELNVQRLHFCFLYPPILFRTVVAYIRVKLLFLFLNVQRLCFCFLYPPILFRTMVAYIRVKVLFLYLNVQRLRFCLSLSTHFFPHSECMYSTVQQVLEVICQLNVQRLHFCPALFPTIPFCRTLEPQQG